jgi:hypothetical protein
MSQRTTPKRQRTIRDSTSRAAPPVRRVSPIAVPASPR